LSIFGFLDRRRGRTRGWIGPEAAGARLRGKDRVRHGKPTVIDGPFTEAKEIVAGYWLWQWRSLDEAVEWVNRIPFEVFDDGTDRVGEVEIRQVYENEDFGESLPTPSRRPRRACGRRSPESSRTRRHHRLTGRGLRESEGVGAAYPASSKSVAHRSQAQTRGPHRPSKTPRSPTVYRWLVGSDTHGYSRHRR
jgi:hypothetical protein